jgi:hypothetical protein
MEIITLDHYQNYYKVKKFTKLKRSSDIGEEEEDINITWNGKAIPSLRQHGNMCQPFPQMEICWKNTKIKINYRNQLDNYKIKKKKKK